LLQEIQIGFGFTFLLPAHPGSPGQNPEGRSRKMVVLVVVVVVVLAGNWQISTSQIWSQTGICLYSHIFTL